MTEYLLTSHNHIKADVETDRGWRAVRMGHDGVQRIVKPDGAEVRAIFSPRSVCMILPHSTVHIGYGFLTWRPNERAEVESYLKSHGHSIIYDVDHVAATEVALNVRAEKRKRA